MSRREQLESARDHLSGLLVGADERSAPALSRELRAVLSELESLPVEGKKSRRDELQERRATRQAEAAARVDSSKSV